jgi:FtsP/CotA-like multicopper oxidase with cupredoxin domain
MLIAQTLSISMALIVSIGSRHDDITSMANHPSARAPFDGWAEDVTEPQSYKDYYYPNGQNARTLWYHDHAIDHTAENAYMGQAGTKIPK